MLPAILRTGRPAALASLALMLVTGCASTSKPTSKTAPPELAFEVVQIARSYDYYNGQLKKLNLSASPGVLGLFISPDTDSLKRYYTQEKSKKHDQCRSSSACRKSEVAALRAQTMGSYSVVRLEQSGEDKASLVVAGTTTSGNQRRVTVDWLLENGRWRINEVSSSAPDAQEPRAAGIVR
jgi:hypothetical protein